MRYELLLQAAPGGVFDLAAAVEALATRRPVSGEAPRRWELEAEDIEVHPLREGDRIVALELHVPLMESDRTIREALREAADVARSAGMTLYDPQLNRAVGITDEGAVVDQFQRNARYAGEVAGVSGLAGIGVRPEGPGFQLSGKIVLGVIGLVILFFLLSDIMTRVVTATR